MLLAKTDSGGADSIIAHAAQAVLDACDDLELEVRETRTIEAAARLASVIHLLEEQLACLSIRLADEMERATAAAVSGQASIGESLG